MDPNKAILTFIVTFLIFAGSFISGYLYSNTKSAPILADFKARVDEANKQVKALTKRQEEDNVVIKNEIDASLARIDAEHQRVLQGKDRIHTRALAECAEKANGTAEELATLKGLAEFEHACKLDANTVYEFQRWVNTHKFPIGD